MTRDVSTKPHVETPYQYFLTCVLSTENFIRKLRVFSRKSKNDTIKLACSDLEDALKLLIGKFSKSFYKNSSEEEMLFQENRILLVMKIIGLQLNSFLHIASNTLS